MQPHAQHVHPRSEQISPRSRSLRHLCCCQASFPVLRAITFLSRLTGSSIDAMWVYTCGAACIHKEINPFRCEQAPGVQIELFSELLIARLVVTVGSCSLNCPAFPLTANYRTSRFTRIKVSRAQHKLNIHTFIHHQEFTCL